MQTACLITTTIAAIGAINYGFTAIPRSNDDKDCKRNLNLINLAFNKVPSIERSIYLVFAFAGIFTIYCTFFNKEKIVELVETVKSE